MSLLIILQLAYLITLISICAYAIRCGGRPERQGAAIMIAGSVLTVPAASLVAQWQSPALGVLAVDMAVLAAFLAIALRSDRYWPLWTTAFQLVGVATHLARLADPGIIPRAYSIAQGFWAYPMLVALAIGVRESRSRVMPRGVRF
ncbi:hypothetical protein [Sphingomonas montanisoli]|uniref:Uncharacterized protein n=1 Tax=Sphingomonas montanisoli TaxID=2606412 RepID=A0A5D9C4Q4_9SPHN|nr:hypothetical protein [Sphingomonas montanisoli]TZG26192.1 hypothetical protein FYJ91_14685 [Sphingomonas montanisoli]